jgi:hypothetical protein
MEVIPLPGARIVERSALKQSLVVMSHPSRRPRLAVRPEATAQAYCANCAGPIEFGAVIRGREAYCSVECSLEGDRPA